MQASGYPFNINSNPLHQNLTHSVAQNGAPIMHAGPPPNAPRGPSGYIHSMSNSNITHALMYAPVQVAPPPPSLPAPAMPPPPLATSYSNTNPPPNNSHASHSRGTSSNAALLVASSKITKLRTEQIRYGVLKRFVPLYARFESAGDQAAPDFAYFNERYSSELLQLCKELDKQYPDLPLCFAKHNSARKLLARTLALLKGAHEREKAAGRPTGDFYFGGADRRDHDDILLHLSAVLNISLAARSAA